MKLYSVAHSPYASRIRIQIYHSNLPVEIAEPLGGLGSEPFKALTPSGKAPTLALDDGSHLPESMAIMEYLEERFTESGLMPAGLEQRAWVRAVSRFADIYLTQALFPLFMELKLKSGDQDALGIHLNALAEQLATLEKYLILDYRPDAGQLDCGDCALVPTLFYVTTLAPIFGQTDILAATPHLSAWWSWVQEQPAVARVLEEMRVGLKAMMGG